MTQVKLNREWAVFGAMQPSATATFIPPTLP